MKKREYVLYKGENFTVEWYYTSEGKSQPFEYFNSLNIHLSEKEKAGKCRKDYEERVKGGTYYDNI